MAAAPLRPGKGVPVGLAFGVGAAVVGPGGGGARLRAMMLVSSASNLSRSASATACGDVNVKLWPASLLTSPTFSRTCSAPTLLRERA